MTLPDLNPILKQLAVRPACAVDLHLSMPQSWSAQFLFPESTPTALRSFFTWTRSPNLKEIARTLRVNYPSSHPITLLHNDRLKRLTLGEVRPDSKVTRNTVLYVLLRAWTPGRP